MDRQCARALALLVVALACVARGENPVQFTDVTARAGISFRHVNGATGKRYFIETMGPGCAFLDYNSDGYLDIYMVNGHDLAGTSLAKATNVLYRNNGDGTFADVAQKAGVGDAGYGMGVVAADYDNDGDTDLYITNYGPNVLYRNDGDGSFTDVAQKAGVGDDRWGVGCAFLDYDSDGYLDLYVANYVDFSLEHPRETLIPYLPVGAGQGAMTDVTAYPHPDGFNGAADVLYRNRGDGTFADVTRRAGVYNPKGKGMGIVCGDYDNDGDVDLYVANDLTPNFLYRNNGDGTFTDVGLLTGVAYSEDGKMESSMGADFGDYDRDGYMDLIVPNFQGEATRVYRNTGDGFFSDESATSGIGAATRAYVGWGVGFLDYDNDGGLDLFIAAGHVLDNVKLFDTSTSYPQRNFLFRNSGPGKMGTYTFTDVSAVAGGGLAVAKSSRGTAFGDYDNDGDVDILVVNCNDSATLLRNDGGNRGHWLRIKTEGVRSNRDGIGARIEAISGNLIQLREVRSGSSLYCQNDLRASFGLGDRSKVDRIEIRWPSGITDTLVNLSADQSIAVREGFGLIEAGR